MRFDVLHKASSYGVAGAGLASLLLTPDVTLLATLVSVIAVALSWFADPQRFFVQRMTWAWNVATIVFLGWLLIHLYLGESVVTLGIHFVIFLLVNKLFNRAALKDYYQAYVVSFLMLALATTINTTLAFGVCFVVYVVCITWALILQHLRREVETHHHPRRGEGADGPTAQTVDIHRVLRSRRIIGVPFLAGTSLIALGIIVGSMLFFAVFPRMGFGLFASYRRGGMMIAGFQDEVTLGQHGTIRDNPEVVMRVSFPQGYPGVPLRWRGTALDTYERGVWSHGSDLRGFRRSVTPEDNLFLFNRAPGLPRELAGDALRGALLAQDIYLEPIESMVIFAADRPVAVDVPRSPVTRRRSFDPLRGPSDEIHARRKEGTGVRYLAYSWVQQPPAALLQQAPHATGRERWRYLQLPSDFPARVRELAERITADQQTLYARVIAIQNHLQRGYRYSTRLRHDPNVEPVESFLFVTREGHCEYFASAMSLMLRAVGIATRQVNGFSGGEWNSYGNYLAVRQGDAHSWTEVFFPGVGWVAFDPTPPAGRPETALGASVLGRVRHMLDALRMRWYLWVIEYDLNKQLSAVRQVGRVFRQRPRTISPRRSFAAIERRTVVVAVGGALLLVLVGFAWWQRRHLQLSLSVLQGNRAHWATQLYRRMLKTLAKRGVSKAAHLTADEFVRLLRQQGDVRAAIVAEITAGYYRARFGAALGHNERTHLAAQVRSLAKQGSC